MKALAYFTHTFPTISTTFTQNQIRTTERLGLTGLFSSINRPQSNEYNPTDQDFLDNTFYLTPVKLAVYLSANAVLFLKSPLRYFKTLILALTLTDRDYPPVRKGLFGAWRQRTRNIIHLAGAAVLGRHLERNGVKHVHVHFAFGAAGIAIFLDALTGIGYSLTIHGSDVLLPNPLTEEKLRRARFVVSNCHYHICNLRRRYSSLEKQRFFVVRGGVELDSGSWSRTMEPENDPCLRILHVARLEPVKAQDVLIRSLAELRDKGVDFECRLVGDGPLRAELGALIKELGLENRVFLLGALFIPEVVELYDWCQVVVLSSRSEGTPMVIVEAMAKARPVVVPDITAIPEMVRDGTTGFLFTSGSASHLAEKLACLAGNHELIVTMGQKARKMAEELFDVETNTRKLIDIFNQEIPALRQNQASIAPSPPEEKTIEPE